MISMNLARSTNDQDAFPDSKSFIKYKNQLPAAARLAATNSRGRKDTRVEVMERQLFSDVHHTFLVQI